MKIHRTRTRITLLFLKLLCLLPNFVFVFWNQVKSGKIQCTPFCCKATDEVGGLRVGMELSLCKQSYLFSMSLH